MILAKVIAEKVKIFPENGKSKTFKKMHMTYTIQRSDPAPARRRRKFLRRVLSGLIKKSDNMQIHRILTGTLHFETHDVLQIGEQFLKIRSFAHYANRFR